LICADLLHMVAELRFKIVATLLYTHFPRERIGPGLLVLLSDGCINACNIIQRIQRQSKLLIHVWNTNLTWLCNPLHVTCFWLHPAGLSVSGFLYYRYCIALMECYNVTYRNYNFYWRMTNNIHGQRLCTLCPQH